MWPRTDDKSSDGQILQRWRLLRARSIQVKIQGLFLIKNYLYKNCWCQGRFKLQRQWRGLCSEENWMLGLQRVQGGWGMQDQEKEKTKTKSRDKFLLFLGCAQVVSIIGKRQNWPRLWFWWWRSLLGWGCLSTLFVQVLKDENSMHLKDEQI